MEPEISMIIFSKYSPVSKKLINIINSYNNYFNNLQVLCIDNNNIRKRILSDRQIDVNLVPCILLLYSDGVIEKFDGIHAFKWVENIIEQNSPPEVVNESGPDPSTQRVESVPKKISEEMEYNKIKIIRSQELKDIEEKISLKKELLKKTSNKIESPIPRPQTSENMKEINDIVPNRTSIEDLGDSTGRHRNLKPMPSIRENSGNYIQNTEMFQDVPENSRKHKRSAIKKQGKKSMDLMERAKELAKAREIQTPVAPKGHPAAGRL